MDIVIAQDNFKKLSNGVFYREETLLCSDGQIYRRFAYEKDDPTPWRSTPWKPTSFSQTNQEILEVIMHFSDTCISSNVFIAERLKIDLGMLEKTILEILAIPNDDLYVQIKEILIGSWYEKEPTFSGNLKKKKFDLKLQKSLETVETNSLSTVRFITYKHLPHKEEHVNFSATPTFLGNCFLHMKYESISQIRNFVEDMNKQAGRCCLLK